MLRRSLLMLMMAGLFLTAPGLLAGSGWQDWDAAQAKGGKGGGGNDDDDRDDDRDDDDDDNSGHGGGGDDDDDDDDDNSGHGGGGGKGDDDDDDDDDNGGRPGGGGNGGGSGGGSGNGSGSNGGAKGQGGSSDAPSTSADSGTLFRQDVIRIGYQDGSSERIVGNRYEKLDGKGRKLESRTVKSADRKRLDGLRKALDAGQGRKLGLEGAAIINAGQKALQSTDIAGWTEYVLDGRYVLTDPQGNVVTRRKAQAKDIRRLKQALGLD
jgi:hypothetical protein